MPMEFWPSTDFDRIVDLFDAIGKKITPPSTNYKALFDPETTFDPPEGSGDPTQPAMFATWGFDENIPLGTLEPDRAAMRRITVSVSFWTERGEVSGAQTGYNRGLAGEFFRELQDATNHPAGVDFIPQSMRWRSLGRSDPDWIESQMSFDLTSQ